MGKRKKSSKPTPKKKKDPLPSAFACLFCNHDNSVSVKLDKKAGIGELVCKVCGQQFQTGINYLSAGVDVYSDWIDACDSVAKEAADLGGDAEDSNTYHHRVTLGDRTSGGRRVSTNDGIQDDEMGVYGDDDA
ncbi:MAG: hypothetical protein LQ346_000249 [Caloplaca aetnensis]|nr:MAG: hypothetical protein LQ346_000249 [Caloplaca aetnensis]